MHIPSIPLQRDRQPTNGLPATVAPPGGGNCQPFVIESGMSGTRPAPQNPSRGYAGRCDGDLRGAEPAASRSAGEIQPCARLSISGTRHARRDHDAELVRPASAPANQAFGGIGISPRGCVHEVTAALHVLNGDRDHRERVRRQAFAAVAGREELAILTQHDRERTLRRRRRGQ